MPAAPKPADMTDLVELKQLPARRSKAALALGAFDLKLVDVHLDLPLTRARTVSAAGREERATRRWAQPLRLQSPRAAAESEATMTSGGTVVGYATAHRSKPRAIYHPL